MAQQIFYSEDAVRLKIEPSRIGLVDRTFANVETHSPDPLEDTLGGAIQRGDQVDSDAFDEFLQTGVPPRGTVLVTWVFSPGTQGSVYDPVLIPENELELVDRALLFGDVVKRSTADATSGTIVQAFTTVSLLQPLPWPSNPNDSQTDPIRQATGPYLPTHADTTSLLRDIPVDELIWPNEIERDQIVIYKDWVGVVEEIQEDIFVRLNNNTVVVPEDCSYMRSSDDDSCQVNDRVKCIKASLRRGRWIFGAYDANVNPEALIVEIRPRRVMVDWLVCNRPYWGQITPDLPPRDLERDDIESGDFRIYDRRKVPVANLRNACISTHTPQRANLGVAAGDRVRFRDLAAASDKYDKSTDYGNGNTNQLSRIHRTETLGFDINVFTVLETKTVVDVLWQDGTFSQGVPTNELCPFLDLENEEEVWPGELVVTKKEKVSAPDPDYVRPEQTGIVQYVNAQERLAYVKWFEKGFFAFSRDHPSYLHKKCNITTLAEQVSEVSLYDIATVPNFARRLGDLVVIAPSDFAEALVSRKSKTIPGREGVRFALSEHPDGEDSEIETNDVEVKTENRIDDQDSEYNTLTWIGEIIELGLDGLLTVRLGALVPPRDIRVPWHCTVIAHSNDEEEDDNVTESITDPDDIFSDDISVTSADRREINGLFPSGRREIWRDEDGNEIVLGVNEWSTEEEEEVDDDDDSMSVDSLEEDSDVAGDNNDESTHEKRGAILHPAGPEEDVDVEMKDLSLTTAVETEVATDKQPVLSNVTPTNNLSISETFDYSTMFESGFVPTRSTSEENPARPESFSILDGSPPQNHGFLNRKGMPGSKTLRAIQQQYQMLRESLPPGAFVRTWESKTNLMRLLLLGPLDTPYEYAPFVFDFYMDSSFPLAPPEVHFHSWTSGDGPCNPNLYEDGKVCLSLLGTWAGNDEHESWKPGKSSILQVVVSLLGLVLVKEPYFNEAGFESRVGTAESRIPSLQYSERAYFRTRSFINHALRRPIPGFEQEVEMIYVGQANTWGPRVLQRAIESGIEVIKRSATPATDSEPVDPPKRISAGAMIPLCRELDELIGILIGHDSQRGNHLRSVLQEARKGSSS